MSRRLPVWPYYFLAALGAIVAAVLLTLYVRADLPEMAELERVSGSVATFVLIDDLSGEPTMMRLPTSSAHFTLKGVDGEFKYPARFPGYTDVYDRLAFDVDVWVRRDSLGEPEPMLVYQLVQHLPENFPSEPISVSYEQIVGARVRQIDSYRRAAAVLFAGAVLLAGIGLLIGRWNRRARRAPPPAGNDRG